MNGSSLNKVLGLPNPDVRTHPRIPTAPTHVRHSDGKWYPRSDFPTPLFIHAVSSSPEPEHFLISIILSFPNRKPIRTTALVDSSASQSCISKRFATRHSLPRRLKDTPIPILAVDDRPIASGLVTQDVIANISIETHAETFPLAVVSVAFPVILGLDWLCVHNPNVDWADPSLELSCCNLTPSNPVCIRPIGFGLVGTPAPALPRRTCAVSSVGLGLGLFPNPVSRSPSTENSKSSSSTSASILSFLSSWASSGRSSLVNPLTPPTPRISICSIQRFAKYAKNQQVGMINVHAVNSPIYIAATLSAPTSSLSDDISEPTPASPNTSYLPNKYFPWADTVFSATAVNDLPPHRPYDCAIDVEEGKSLPFGPMYRLSHDETKALSDYLDDNLAKGFIRCSTSSAASPILFVKRKTGELRLCVDYRGLNSITKKNRYPIPHIDDLLDQTQGCQVFSVIDLKNAFNLVRIRAGDEWKTAFRTPKGLYEYLVMPFGLTNAPATFQSFIQDTLREYLGIFCVVYLDDILIFSKTQTEHDNHVKLILDKLKDAHLFANPQKCEFDKSQVEYLGFLVGADGIKMNPKKLSTITDWPTPHSAHDIQVFLGFCNFYRRFVNHYADIAVPLNRLTRKDTPFRWTDKENLAFERLKSSFLSYPVLRHYDPSKPTTLFTDASDFALSGILQQPDEFGSLRPIAFFSRKFSPAEINYDIHDKELLAVIESFRNMRAWLMGTAQPISVVCDHKNLEYFMSSRVLNRRQARWAMFLSNFDFTLTWAPGSQNPADGPSRRPDFAPKKGDTILQAQNRLILTPYHTQHILPFPSLETPPSRSFHISAITTLAIDNSELLQQFKSAYQEDPTWREALLHGDTDFSTQDNLVFHKGRIYVPPSLRTNILHQHHDAVISGHPGRTTTLNNVLRNYSWPGIYTFIRRYVAACDTCARIKIPRHKPYGLLKPLDIPDRPWKSISMDFIVKLPKSHGYDSIFVVCDRLTRAAHFIPCNESMTAGDLAWLFLDRLFRHHGLPDSIISDHGSTFVSNFWKALTSQLGITLRHSTAYHPRTDGLTERTNQTLETYICAYCSYQQDDWVDYLPLAEFVFNNTENSSTKQTPFFANCAFHPTFTPKLSETSTVPAADELAQRLDNIHAELKAELEIAQQRQQYQFNKHVLPSPKYQPDQLVWLLRRNIRTTRPSLKLDHRRLGPFPVVREIGNDAYLLRLPPYLSRLHPVFHTSLLEPYSDPSEFHTHATPEPFQLADDSTLISDVLDCRKTGHRYNYLVRWKDQPAEEDLWISLQDLPTTANEIIERFHRRHPRAPRPHPLIINHLALSPSDFNFDSISDTDSVSISIPDCSLHARPRSPPPSHNNNLRSFYTPPSITTLSSGRVSRPPSRFLDSS